MPQAYVWHGVLRIGVSTHSACGMERQLEPASVAIFGGVIDPAKPDFPFNRIAAADARDWDAIRSWADSLSEIFAACVAA